VVPLTNLSPLTLCCHCCTASETQQVFYISIKQVSKMSGYVRSTFAGDKSAPWVWQCILLGGQAVVQRAAARVDVQQLAAVNTEPRLHHLEHVLRPAHSRTHHHISADSKPQSAGRSIQSNPIQSNPMNSDGRRNTSMPAS